MLQIWNLFLVYNIFSLWKSGETVYVGLTSAKMIKKIRDLARESVADAIMKIESILHFRDAYYKSTAFQMGDIVYNMRDKYKKMVLKYQRVLDRHEKKIINDHMDELFDTDSLYHEIHNLARMVKMWEANRGRYSSIHSSLLRTYGEVKMWYGLAESASNEQSTPPPPEAKPDTGRRKNGKWHYVVSNEFDK